jgi:hypothetical protein
MLQLKQKANYSDINFRIWAAEYIEKSFYEFLSSVNDNSSNLLLLSSQLSSLFKFLSALLSDQMFSISASTNASLTIPSPSGAFIPLLRMLLSLFDHFSKEAKPHLPHILPALLAKSGDGSATVRAAIENVLCHLIARLTPSPFLPTLITSIAHENWRVRRQAVVALTYSMVCHKNYNFEFGKLTQTLCLALEDPKQKVCEVIVEALAVIYSVKGLLSI